MNVHRQAETSPSPPGAIARGALPLLLAAVLTVLACAAPVERGPALRTVRIDSLPLALSALDSATWTVPGRTATGELRLALDAGDYRLPALGPAGRRVAAAEVDRGDDVVRSRVLVASLDADSVRVLLGYDRVAGCGAAHYSPWIHGLSWRGADTLVARIADGDVGSTAVTLDAATGEVLSERYEQGDPPEPLPAEEAALRDRIVSTFPGWRPEVVTSTLRMGQYLATGEGVLLQKRYAEEDAHLRWLDWASGDTTLLLTMPRDLRRRGDLRPGVAVGGRALFPLVADQRVHLFGFRPGESLVHWGSVPAGPSHYTQVREVARRGDTAVVQTDVASGSGCCAHEPVLRVTPDALVEWDLGGAVSDVDVSFEHGLVAWTEWATPDSTRTLRVRRLAR